ncbi:MAG: flagellar basal body-associated FliL family protein [Alphaproteobacteria bacterium]|nr:flagellar basal body-associated FliL family protein [Alphaproteobacteria bacterium]
MAEEKELENSTPKGVKWLAVFFVTCICAFALFWAVFGVWSYLYPSNVTYTFRPQRRSEQVSLSGKDGAFFVGLPIQHIQLAESTTPYHTLEIQIAFSVKQASDKEEILSKLPVIQDALITNLRTLSVEQLQENGRLFYLKESLLAQMNNLLYPVKIQDVLFQKIVVRESS